MRNLDPIDITLMALRVASCSGQPFLFVHNIGNRVASFAEKFLHTNGYTSNEFRKSIRHRQNMRYFIISPIKGSFKVFLSPEGLERADQLLGTVRYPRKMRVRRKDPYVVTLDTVYHFTTIDLITFQQHHYFVNVRFIRRETLDIVDDPKDADDVAGVIRVLTKAPWKERVNVNILSAELLTRKPRVTMLLQFGLGRFESVAEIDVILAETLAGICAIKQLLGCRLRGGNVVWGDQILF